jgi:AcrR family transcriptional regulator
MSDTERKPGRPRNPDLEARRRAEILEVAGTVFARHGFAATQVQTIADELGIGNGTIYRYFPNKETLFLAAVEKGLAVLRETMDRIMQEHDDPFVQIEQAILAYLTFFHTRPHMAELFIQERAAFRDRHRPLYFQTKDEHEKCQHDEFFRRLMETKKVRTMDQEEFMSVLGDLLYGTILTNLLTGRPVEPTNQARAILNMVLHGILLPRSAAPSRTPHRSSRRNKVQP